MKWNGVLQCFGNRHFARLFLKNTALFFFSTLFSMVLSLSTIYLFSSRLLIKEVDAANLRSVENMQGIFERLCEETEYDTMTMSLYSDTQSLYRTSGIDPRSYQHLMKISRLQETMNKSKSVSHGDTVVLFFDKSEYLLSSLSGGQRYIYYEDQDLLNQYSSRKEYRIRCVKQTLYGRPEWHLTYYQPLSLSPDERSFIAVNLNVQQLLSYLLGEQASQDTRVLVTDPENTVMIDSEMEWMGQQLTSCLGEELSFSDGSSKTILLNGQQTRASWTTSSSSGWNFIQIIPFDAYTHTMLVLRRYLLLLIAMGVVVAVAAAFILSKRSFRPIADILNVVENPIKFQELDDSSGEVKYLLLKILASFQQNITLEEEMVKKVAALRSTRTRALQKQMTPHFLYNALQAINWLACAETGREDSETCQAIVTLSELTRIGMEQSDNFVSLQTEIDYVQKFFQIEQLRYGESIQCRIECPEELLPQPVLRLCIQPLVENAVSHGLGPQGGQGRVEVHISPGKEGMDVVVEDSGVGMPEEKIEQFHKLQEEENLYTNRHIGLINLSQRIQLIYGEGYQLFLEKSELGGLRVNFTLPYVNPAGHSE